MTVEEASARRWATSSPASVVVGTSYELLVLLYRQVQADHGLPAIPDPGPVAAVPAELRPAADWFFRADIALGMNVIAFAYANGWHTVTDLADGLAATDPADLATAMLRPPDATAAEHRRRDRDVARVLAGTTPPGPLLASLDAERFDASAAADLLADPAAAAGTFTHLIGQYAKVLRRHEHILRTPLAAAADHAEELLAERSLQETAERLFPQWKFHDLDRFDSVVLIPSQAIAPFLSARFTTGRRALIVFPIPPKEQPHLAALAASLKAIAHPQRLEILRIAAEAPITGHALARALGLTEATVHHHTSLLRASGLLTSNRDAHRVYHVTRPEALDQLLHHIRRAVRPGPT